MQGYHPATRAVVVLAYVVFISSIMDAFAKIKRKQQHGVGLERTLAMQLAAYIRALLETCIRCWASYTSKPYPILFQLE
jgi:hypothetical protein